MKRAQPIKCVDDTVVKWKNISLCTCTKMYVYDISQFQGRSYHRGMGGNCPPHQSVLPPTKLFRN